MWLSEDEQIGITMGEEALKEERTLKNGIV